MMERSDPFLAMTDGGPITGGGFDDLRGEGRESYRKQGLPGPKTEPWRYTNLNPLRATGFAPADPAVGAAVKAVPDSAAGIDAYRAVMVNGQFRADLSDLGGLPTGVNVRSLADGTGNGAAARPGGILALDAMPLAALNAAHFTDGVAIMVESGVQLERPLHVVSIGQGGGAATLAFHPRIMAVIGNNARADIIESHVGDGAYFSNTVAEIRLGANAHCGHYKLQSESPDAFHIAATGVELAEAAGYDGFVLQMGGSLARNEVRPTLAGEHGEARLIGAYIGGGSQHIDNSTFIDHAMPNCASREVYKGVLEDSAHGVFQGKILVRPDAQKTDGYQINRALLLSDQAEINSKPELEIYADDVICSHGATAGQLDPDHLFYLRARGLDEATARGLLIDSFLQEAVAEIRSEAVAKTFAAIIRQRLGTPA